MIVILCRCCKIQHMFTSQLDKVAFVVVICQPVCCTVYFQVMAVVIHVAVTTGENRRGHEAGSGVVLDLGRGTGSGGQSPGLVLGPVRETENGGIQHSCHRAA